MGNVQFSDFDSLFFVCPSPVYDTFICSYIKATGTDHSQVINTPWTERALSQGNVHSTNAVEKSKSSPLSTKRKYKPVHRKVRPVPTYMPNPEAQQFLDIPAPVPTILPTHPPDYRTLHFGSRVSRERLELMLGKIEPNTLTAEEINLLVFVVTKCEMAFAFVYAEKGTFSRQYYPDYKIPTIEHMPWQENPLLIPLAILNDVRKVIKEQEEAGRFEPTTSSYCSSMFAVAKKGGV